MKVLLIGGCDRSGTTMLGAMLGAAPGAVCTPESQFKTEILEGGNAAALLGAPGRALAAIEAHWRFATWGLGTEAIGRVSASKPSDYTGLLEALVDRYAARQRAGGRRDGAPRIWVDHTPSNIRHLKRLFSLFPEARAIHLVRDGRAVAASVLPLDWGPNTAFFAAEWWSRCLSPGLAAEKRFGPEKLLRVRYEDLAASPRAVLKRICRFADIDYVERMEEASTFRVPAYTAAHHHRLFSGRIDRRRVRAWRSLLTPRQIERFEYGAGDLLDYLGYEPDHRWPAAPSVSERAAIAGREALLQIANRLRRSMRKRRHLRL